MTSSNTSGMLGLGWTLHAGYSFGLLSVELVAAGLFTDYDDKYQLTPGSNGDVDFQSIGGFVGPAARVTSQSGNVRFTASFGLGTAIRVHVRGFPLNERLKVAGV